MKKLGIIGGLSPESTVKYYQWLNDGVRSALGGHHSANLVIASVDFGLFCDLKQKGDWDTQGRLLAAEARSLENAGAEIIILATNTMHKMADEIQAAISVPFLHLADATAKRIKASGFNKAGLLGTRYTMEMDFYTGRLAAHGIEPIVPDDNGRTVVNDIIYDELTQGVVRDESRAAFTQEIDALKRNGAECVILGCTEITMLIAQENSSLPVFDTTRIHVEEALRAMLGRE